MKENRHPEEYETMETRPIDDDNKTEVPDGIESDHADATEQVRSFFQSIESRKKIGLFFKRNRREGSRGISILRPLLFLVMLVCSFLAGKYNVADLGGYTDALLSKIEMKEVLDQFALKLSAKTFKPKSKFTYQVASKNVNVRSAPGNDAEIVNGLKDGEGVWIKNSEDEWVEVYKKKDPKSKSVYKVGYVFREMLKDPQKN